MPLEHPLSLQSEPPQQKVPENAPLTGELVVLIGTKMATTPLSLLSTMEKQGFYEGKHGLFIRKEHSARAPSSPSHDESKPIRLPAKPRPRRPSILSAYTQNAPLSPAQPVSRSIVCPAVPISYEPGFLETVLNDELLREMLAFNHSAMLLIDCPETIAKLRALAADPEYILLCIKNRRIMGVLRTFFVSWQDGKYPRDGLERPLKVPQLSSVPNTPAMRKPKPMAWKDWERGAIELQDTRIRDEGNLLGRTDWKPHRTPILQKARSLVLSDAGGLLCSTASHLPRPNCFGHSSPSPASTLSPRPVAPTPSTSSESITKTKSETKDTKSHPQKKKSVSFKDSVILDEDKEEEVRIRDLYRRTRILSSPAPKKAQMNILEKAKKHQSLPPEDHFVSERARRQRTLLADDDCKYVPVS